uniref:Tol-pal system protein YbgF n=1 Tax=Geobacter metallireducens TaxID=28232 RepID=A0A831XG23_GEOME
MNIARPISLAALLALAGCATQSDLDVVRRDNEELKTRIFRLEKDLGGIRSETRAGIETTLQDFEKERAGLRKGLADLQATMDATKVDLQVMAGKVDDLSVALRKPADEVNLLKEDLERRLTALEERLAGVQKKVTDMETAQVKPPEPATPETLYQKGLDAYRSGNFPGARETFARFLEQHPKHDLAANARYWTGESYYSEKKFEQAILEFQEVIKNFPGKEKVPAAMLKQAAAFHEIGDVKSARYVLRKLADEHPATEEGKLAKERLKTLK